MSQPLLLDTCAALWMMGDELKPASNEALAKAHDADMPIYVSPIMAWEIGNLARKRRFTSNLTPQLWFNRLLTAPGVELCDMPAGLLLRSAFLWRSMKRPTDRIIAATAREYGFTVMTRDHPLLDYAKEGHLSAIEMLRNHPRLGQIWDFLRHRAARPSKTCSLF